MEFVWTIALAAAAFFGLSELTTLVTTWWEGEVALDAAASAIGAEYPEAAALVASTTEAVRAVTEAAEAW